MMYTLPRTTRYKKQVVALKLLANTASLIKTIVFNTEVEIQEEDEPDDVINRHDEAQTEQLMDYSYHESMSSPRELEIDDDTQAKSL